MKDLFETQALVVEPSSAITVAYVKKHSEAMEEPICVILTGENTGGFNAAVTVNAGTMVLGGTTATAGDIASATSATVNGGGLLHLDNTSGNNQDRLGDTAAVNLNGSALLLSGNASAATAEQFGNVAINPGEHFVSTMTINPAATAVDN